MVENSENPAENTAAKMATVSENEKTPRKMRATKCRPHREHEGITAMAQGSKRRQSVQQRSIEEEFAFVLKTFFPRWWAGRQWTATIVPELDSQAKCETVSKTIQFAEWPCQTEATAVMIHEVCHAVTELRHGAKWRRRMSSAADVADRLRLDGVAAIVRSDLEAPLMTQSLMYGMIEDFATEQPELSFEQTMEAVAEMWGVSSEEARKFLPRASAVFREAKLRN